jgi:hypothetical protein
MKTRWPVAVLFFATLSMPIAIAQSGFPGPTSENYVPRLTEIMNVIQSQHMKLWLAGKAHNWDLAGHELRQLTASLGEAASLYSGLPSNNVVTLTEPIRSISDSLEAKDPQAFRKAIGNLTKGCNACHRSMGRGFIVIRTPAGNDPFGNQVFSPAGKE